ncbi:MAG: hypothetical protein WBO55_20090, partial [Rhizobiaceae bacterium]
MRLTELSFFVGASLYGRNPLCRLKIEGNRPGERADAELPHPLVQRFIALIPDLEAFIDRPFKEPAHRPHVGHLLLGLIDIFAAELGWCLENADARLGPSDAGMELIFDYEGQAVAERTVMYSIGFLRMFSSMNQNPTHLVDQFNRTFKQFFSQ